MKNNNHRCYQLAVTLSVIIFMFGQPMQAHAESFLVKSIATSAYEVSIRISGSEVVVEELTISVEGLQPIKGDIYIDDPTTTVTFDLPWPRLPNRELSDQSAIPDNRDAMYIVTVTTVGPAEQVLSIRATHPSNNIGISGDDTPDQLIPIQSMQLDFKPDDGFELQTTLQRPRGHARTHKHGNIEYSDIKLSANFADTDES